MNAMYFQRAYLVCVRKAMFKSHVVTRRFLPKASFQRQFTHICFPHCITFWKYLSNRQL